MVQQSAHHAGFNTNHAMQTTSSPPSAPPSYLTPYAPPAPAAACGPPAPAPPPPEVHPPPPRQTPPRGRACWRRSQTAVDGGWRAGYQLIVGRAAGEAALARQPRLRMPTAGHAHSSQPAGQLNVLPSSPYGSHLRCRLLHHDGRHIHLDSHLLNHRPRPGAGGGAGVGQLAIRGSAQGALHAADPTNTLLQATQQQAGPQLGAAPAQHPQARPLLLT